ncbi:MAG TPA: serine hydrolase domain-containing protein, partial [Bryobacteraceae bacterium]|nr:serine hydrolase domain-containing protein [Bryobacteraceae bacterium]
MLPTALERQQFLVLYRQFLFRIIELDGLSRHAQGDSSRLLGQFAALLVFLSLLFCLPTVAFGKQLQGQALLLSSWSMEHVLIATTMLVVGLFAVLSWDSTFPDRRDLLVLAPFPVRPRTILSAKLAAVVATLAMTVGTLHCFTGVLWPGVLNQTSPAQVVPAWTSERALEPVSLDELKPVLDRDFADAKVLGPGGPAGLAIGVWQRGREVVLTYGVARHDSVFEIGSVTKTFTAFLLAQMAAEGKVRLDQSVRELLPRHAVSRRPWDAEITLLDLATHTAGFGRFPRNFRLNEPASYTRDDLYAWVRGASLKRPEKRVFRYSNSGYALLGQALANAAGRPWAELVQERITGPLALTDTSGAALRPDQQSRFLQGHDASYRPVPSPAMGALAPAGSIRSTAPDMMKWIVAHLHPPDGFRPVIDAILQPRGSSALRGRGYALAWFPDMTDGTAWHGGATAGFSANVFVDRRRDLAYVVLANNDGGSV